MTGVSGSGKSSLAFDTIYAEGQRRYVESLSAYARQFTFYYYFIHIHRLFFGIISQFFNFINKKKMLIKAFVFIIVLTVLVRLFQCQTN